VGMLSGIRVLDLSRVMSGPYCTALLADLGADVIKVETPGSGDDSRHFGPFEGASSIYFALLNRSKRSITLNLKDKKARELLGQLAAKCDVVVENFRPGVAERLECDAARLRKINPRLVYLSISGFGQAGPLADWPAYDLVIQAMSGLMSTTGSPDGPPTASGESISDVWTGLYGSWAVLVALLHRERTGEGQVIDLAMFDSMLAMQLTGLARITASGKAPVRVGNRHPVTSPVDTYATNDGDVAMVVTTDRQFSALCKVIGQPLLSEDPRFVSNAKRRENYSLLKAAIEAWSAPKTTVAVVDALQSQGIPAGPVWNLKTAYESEQAKLRGALTPTSHPAIHNLAIATQPAKFSGNAGGSPKREPLLGEHTDEVLQELLDLDPAAIASLRAGGSV
jgi:CoA:oxalate CoA-transferase